jgi:MFS superfamily sulfate permease-like transporter
VQAIDKLDPEKRTTPLNRELFAQGVGNSVSGLLGGLPLTSVIVRSSANVNAGGKSKLSSIMHGFILLASLLFFPKLLNYIPLCALAAILIYTGFKLASPNLFKAQWKLGKMSFIPFLLTIISILFTDLLIGIGIGLLLGVFFVIRSNYRVAIRSAKIEAQHLIKFSDQVTFLNKSLLREKLEEIERGNTVTIDLSQSRFIDHDILDMLADYKTKAALNNIQLSFQYINDRQKQKFNL